MVERRLAAILAADVVGYSKLIGQDQAGTLATLRAFRSEVFSPTVNQHFGETVKSMGDGWIVTFPTISDAVNCAIDVQTALIAAPKLRLRIGIHLGDIVHEDQDVFGDGVNIASRLEAAASPGDILISDVVHHSLDGQLAGVFRKSVPLKLKNIERNVIAFAWNDASTDSTSETATEKPNRPERRIIDLGFDGIELSAGDHEAKLLCEGVNEAIRSTLANQPGMSLLTDADQADMLVEGSMKAVGTRYRAVVRLVDRNDRKLIKVEKFDGLIADLFEAEDELALRICTSLRFAAFNYEASTLEKSDLQGNAQDSNALRIRAGGLLSDLKYEEWIEARSLLEAVIERDPEDASALAMAGMSCTIEPNCGWRNSAPEDQKLAIQYLRKAVRLNPNSDFANAILVLALLELAEDHAGAMFVSEQIMQNSPHYAQGQMARAAALISGGETDEGLELALKAIGPLKSLRLFSQNAAYLMMGMLVSHRHSEVLEWGQMVNQRIENVPRILLLMTSAAAHLQDEDLTQRYVGCLIDQHEDFKLSEMRVWPFKRKGDWEHVLAGLVKAGVPD